jgi:NAD(P)-dependent dehydrogenase (short-subunit alcohol dehydrogenase family)
MSVEHMPEADWDRVIGVNLKSCFFLTQAVLPHMRLKGGGSIILVSSCSASLGYRGLSAYGASKAGIEGLVRGLACDLAPDNIRVNAIAPGTTKTPMTRGLWEDAQKCEAHEATIPLRRLGSVDDNANAALFLASDLSSYITGAVLPVDGGLTAMQQDFIDLEMRGWT